MVRRAESPIYPRGRTFGANSWRLAPTVSNFVEGDIKTPRRTSRFKPPPRRGQKRQI